MIEIGAILALAVVAAVLIVSVGSVLLGVVLYRRRQVRLRDAGDARVRRDRPSDSDMSDPVRVAQPSPASSPGAPPQQAPQTEPSTPESEQAAESPADAEKPLSEEGQDALDEVLLTLRIGWSETGDIAADIRRDLSDVLREVSSKEERSVIRSRVKEAIAAARQAEKTWPEDSVNDRIDAALEDLMREGVLVIPWLCFDGFEAGEHASHVQTPGTTLDVVYLTPDDVDQPFGQASNVRFNAFRLLPDDMSHGTQAAERLVRALERRGVPSTMTGRRAGPKTSFPWRKRRFSHSIYAAPWLPVRIDAKADTPVATQEFKERLDHHYTAQTPLDPAPVAWQAQCLGPAGLASWYYIAYALDAFASLDDIDAFHRVHGPSLQEIGARGPNAATTVDAPFDHTPLPDITAESAAHFSSRFSALGELVWLRARGSAEDGGVVVGCTADHWVILLEVDDGLSPADLGM